MALLEDCLHFTMMAFGAVTRLENIKHPNLYMLINKIVFVASLIYIMI